MLELVNIVALIAAGHNIDPTVPAPMEPHANAQDTAMKEHDTIGEDIACTTEAEVSSRRNPKTTKTGRLLTDMNKERRLMDTAADFLAHMNSLACMKPELKASK
mmetsp:Transcript_92610/g.146410  ORF Transcript_92610/g.146410 Transcript_92610/m.146410 type:complete len:104 (-) Transcript_92610:4-315(-)